MDLFFDLSRMSSTYDSILTPTTCANALGLNRSYRSINWSSKVNFKYQDKYPDSIFRKFRCFGNNFLNLIILCSNNFFTSFQSGQSKLFT